MRKKCKLCGHIGSHFCKKVGRNLYENQLLHQKYFMTIAEDFVADNSDNTNLIDGIADATILGAGLNLLLDNNNSNNDDAADALSFGGFGGGESGGAGASASWDDNSSSDSSSSDSGSSDTGSDS